jgi:hypothetical protein
VLANSKVYACIGDSICLNAPTRAFNPWPAALDRKLAPIYGASNRGKNSTTSSEWLTRYGATIDTFGYWGVVIGPCAFNDADTGVAAATSFANIDAIKSDALGRGMRVIIITGLPAAGAPSWNGTKQTAHLALRALILGLSPDPKLAIVDTYPRYGSLADPTILDPAFQGSDLDGYHIGQLGGDNLAADVYAAHRTLIKPTTLSVITGVSAGAVVTETAVAAGDGNAFTNTGSEVLYVTNGGTSDIGVFLETNEPVDGQLAAQVATVAAGQRKAIGPFSPGVYNDELGLARVQFTGTSSVTAAVVRLR